MGLLIASSSYLLPDSFSFLINLFNPEGNKVKRVGYYTFAWLFPSQDEWADSGLPTILIYVGNATLMSFSARQNNVSHYFILPQAKAVTQFSVYEKDKNETTIFYFRANQ